jgi:hypothetical protein
VGSDDPVDDGVAVAGHAAGDDTAGHDQHVGRGDVAELVLDLELQEPLVVGHPPPLRGAQHDLGPRHLGEDLVRAHGVEGGELGEHGNGDLHG